MKHNLDPFDLVGLLVLEAGELILGLAAAAVHAAVLFPMISTPILISVGFGVWVHPAAGVLVAAAFAAMAIRLRSKYPELFDRWVTTRARTRFLAWVRYRRCWRSRMNACHLFVVNHETGVRFVPRIGTVSIGDTIDLVEVRMAPGQCPGDFENRTEQIAHTFGAFDVHVEPAQPGVVQLTFRHSDALADTIILPRVDQWTKPA